MPAKTFHITPVRLIADDPFGLHDPLTFDDLERIEQALADGSVSGDEAERLRAIRDEESARLAEAFHGITNTLSARFGDLMPKIDLGIDTTALLPKIDLAFRYADLMPKIDPGIDTTALLPKIDLASRYADLMPKIDPGIDTTALLPKIDLASKFADLAPKTNFGIATTGLLPKLNLGQMHDGISHPAIDALVSAPVTDEHNWASIESSLDLSLFVDHRPAHMEDLAERQLDALQAACASLEATADAIVKSDQRAEERFEETKRMNRAQTRVVVIVTIVAALLSGLAGALLATFLR